jgi:ubiquinone/menaquinone biosynthesis C-methylase UbiE
MYILSCQVGSWANPVGVDWAEHAINLARQEAEKRGIDATFVVGDITEWQPRNRFDLVINTYALPAGLNRHRALRTARSALSPGGTLIVDERGMGLW